MNKIKWLAEYSFVESIYYDSDAIEDTLRIGHCVFTCNSDTYCEALKYARIHILPKIIKLEVSCRLSRVNVSKFEIKEVSHLIEF